MPLPAGMSPTSSLHSLGMRTGGGNAGWFACLPAWLLACLVPGQRGLRPALRQRKRTCGLELRSVHWHLFVALWWVFAAWDGLGPTSLAVDPPSSAVAARVAGSG